MATPGTSGLGNTLGAWIGDRRSSHNASLIKRFGARVLDRNPGMGEYMSRSLFGASGQESRIKWTVDEIQKLVSLNSGLSSSFIDPKTGAAAKDPSTIGGLDILVRYPIAPTYDYLLTLDLVVGDVVNEINRINSMGSIGSRQRAGIDARVLMPDFRALEFHEQVLLGALDEHGRDVTTGQILGYPRYHTKDAPYTGLKTRVMLMVDNAALLSYVHMNNIIAVSQGLWKVNFTPAKAIVDEGYKGGAIGVGKWINAVDPKGAATGVMAFAAAQDPDPTHYPENHFMPDGGLKGKKAVDVLGNYAAPARWAVAKGRDYVFSENGGAMPALLSDGANNNGTEAKIMAVTDDVIREIANKAVAAKQPMQYFSMFRDIAQELRIDVGLRNLHADLQATYASARQQYALSPTNPSHHVAINNSSAACTPGMVRVFKNSRNEMVSEFVQTSQGKIRNPEIVGVGQCVSIVGGSGPGRAAPNLVPGIAIASVSAKTRKGVFGGRSQTIGSVFGGSRARRSTKSKATKTGRKFQGKAVYRGAKGGLFVQSKGANGKMVKRYI